MLQSNSWLPQIKTLYYSPAFKTYLGVPYVTIPDVSTSRYLFTHTSDPAGKWVRDLFTPRFPPFTLVALERNFVMKKFAVLLLGSSMMLLATGCCGHHGYYGGGGCQGGNCGYADPGTPVVYPPQAGIPQGSYSNQAAAPTTIPGPSTPSGMYTSAPVGAYSAAPVGMSVPVGAYPAAPIGAYAPVAFQPTAAMPGPAALPTY